jgi:cation diffusion facilitator family transporter
VAQPQEIGPQKSQRGAWLSILTYALLTGVKLTVGSWAGSQALVADGVNNATDVAGAVAVLFGLRIAGRPADDDHRYGHQKAETVAAVVVASIMGLAGLNVAVSAAGAAFDPARAAPHPASVWVGVASAAVMLGVFGYNLWLARRTGSRALAAAAYDNRSDALASLAAVAGMAGAQVGWHWADPAAGLLVGLVILRTAWHIGIDAAHHLMDGFDTADLQRIRARVATVDGVLKVHELRARHLGSGTAVEVTIAVHPGLSVVEAHRVSDRVEEALLGFLSIEHVHVHVEPARKAEVAAVARGR